MSRGLRGHTTRAQNAVFRLENRIHDARSKGDWCEVGRLEKQLGVATMRYKSALAKEDVVDRRMQEMM